MRAYRRLFIAALVFLTATTSVVAQQHAEKIPRIGYLAFYSEEGRKLLDAFKQGLKNQGYVEGKNVVIEVRRANGKRPLLKSLASDLLGLKVDIIVAGGRGADAAKAVTNEIPIVLTYSANPVKAGFAASLARPGGNVTGLSDFHGDLVSKRIELLKELAPSLASVAVVFNPARPTSREMLVSVRAAAPVLGIEVLPLPVKKADDFEGVFATVNAKRPGGLIQSVSLGMHRSRIIELAAKSKIPAIYTRRDWVTAGGLMSYGTSWPDLFRQAAGYVDKILRGAKPGDLPVQQPRKFELVVNRKTAMDLGITIPPSILLRADEVIE